MKCTDILVQEHKIILRALDVLDAMASRIHLDQPVAAEDVDTILHFLRTFADNNHQTKEESALFPELLRTSVANQPALRHMVYEHDQERSLVEGLEDALLTKRGAEFVLFANRLTALIRTHIMKEDKILFAVAERSLSAEQDRCISDELNRFPADEKCLADLHRLEWGYLRRAGVAQKSA
jgi:hemerythrin-like domain-containing protein